MQNFKSISIYDFIKSNGIFLINNSLKISDTLKKFTELSFFGFINVTITSKFLVEQNYKNYITDLKNKDYTFDYLYLQSSTFFESSGNYINTEGEVKNTTKLIATTSNSKEDWEILRKLYYFLNTLTFSATPKSNTKIHFDNNNLFNFKILMSLLYINTRSLSKFSFYKRAFNQVFNNPIRIQKLKKLKLLLSQFKIWIEDFFIGGSDNYSTNSQMMTLLSMAFRTEIRTFAS